MTKPTKELFAEALDVLVDGCIDSGMGFCEFIGPLKTKLASLRSSATPGAEEDRYNAERGLSPMTEAQLREALELEPYEPILHIDAH